MNVVITGASRGIGRAVAEIFASHGHSLYLSSLQELNLYKTLEELQTSYPSAVIKAKAFDLSSKEKAQALGRWCLQHAVPDILVNNAGIFKPGSVHNEPDGTLESQIAVNLYSAYHLTRTVLPEMMKGTSTDHVRHIFNICSVAALGAYKNGGAYSISKYAMHGFSKNLREELKPYHIKVTSVHPGAADTDTWGGFDNSGNRIMGAADIAKMVYAASQLSPAACVEEITMRPQLGDL